MNTISELQKLENKKVLFLAETHFQLINCVNIAYYTRDSQCDLFINDMYKDVKEYARRLHDTGLFQKVKIYNVSFSKLEKILKFLTFKKFIAKTFNIFDYDIVFFASRDFLARCVVTYCKYVYPQIKLISYDEGLGTYISRMEEYTNIFEKGVIRFLYHEKPSIITDKILYMPEAYIGSADNVTLYRMPTLSKPVIKFLNNIYDYNDNKQFEERFIYFDNYYDGLNEEKKKIIEGLIKATNQKLQIKKHPQTPDGVYVYDNVYQYPSLPYEIIAANDDNLENRTLITIMSSAVWTPVLLFKKYPKIVLLYQLVNNAEVNEANKIIEKMISLYPKDKVFVINSFEDLKLIQNF